MNRAAELARSTAVGSSVFLDACWCVKLLRGFAFAVIAVIFAFTVQAQPQVEAVIGEAASEPFQTKLAVAGALRNRGTLDGVRGFQNQGMIHRQPAYVWEQARVAWAQSTTNDLTHGATHFESTNFPRPAWSRGMKETARVGRFIFYKP